MLPEADYDLTQSAFMSGGRRGMQPGDENLLVRFFPQPIQNMAKTEAEGRPIFDEVDFIEIRKPGMPDAMYREKANDIDKARFSDYYRDYKERKAQVAVTGTPLSDWPGVTRAQVEEFRHYSILTVEHLATLSDNIGQKFMGIQALKAKAAAYLEASKDQAAANALEETRKQLAESQAMNADLLARIEALEADKPRRGRPPKSDTEE